MFGKKSRNVEYKVLSANSLIPAEQLNDLAKDGWELVEIVPTESTFYYYFKREV
jgi:hypothetical protein